MIFVKNSSINTNRYWIDKINSSFFNKNEFIDIQYCKVIVEQNYYKLKFNLIFYVSNNFFLPANSLTVKAIAPTFEVDNIPLIKTNKTIDTSIENIQKDTIDVFATSFDVDISEDFFFNGTSNKSFDLNLTFNFDSSLLNKDNSNIEANVFETFISELLNCKFDIKINNISYISVLSNGTYNHVYAYENDNLNNYLNHYKKIKFNLENFSSIDYSIKKLFSFEVFDEIKKITISNILLTLNYKHNGIDKIAQLKFDTEYDYWSNNLAFVLNDYETYFDKNKNEIIFQNGNRGIFFPFDTNGFYEIAFALTINNKPIKYKLKNNFSYIYQTNKANFVVEPLEEELIEYEEIFYKEQN